MIPPAEQWGQPSSIVRFLGEYAAGLGLEIALELEPFHLSLLNDVASMARFLDEVDQPAVKANLDISHLVLAKQPPEQIDRLARSRSPMSISPIATARSTATCRRDAASSTFLPISTRSSGWIFPMPTISIELEYSPRAGQYRRVGGRGVREDSRSDAKFGITVVRLIAGWFARLVLAARSL